jgi:uncharacterized C2H2 Zn-finger protein
MPITQKVIFRCERCKFVMTKNVGDVLSFENIYPKCPICGNKMKRSTDLVDILKKLFKEGL